MVLFIQAKCRMSTQCLSSMAKVLANGKMEPNTSVTGGMGKHMARVSFSTLMATNMKASFIGTRLVDMACINRLTIKDTKATGRMTNKMETEKNI